MANQTPQKTGNNGRSRVYWLSVSLFFCFIVAAIIISWSWLSIAVAASWPFQSSVASVVETPKQTIDETPDQLPRRLDGIMVPAAEANPQPIALMIDNVVTALPQAGIASASIIYEALVEGSATRLMAVLAGPQTNKIGPVRSARPYFVDWALEIDAVYGHVGGSPDALEAIDGLGVKDFSQSYNGRYFWRATDRGAPHNVYTSKELMSLFMRDKGYDQVVPTFNSWVFGKETPITERPTGNQRLTLKFANALTRTMEFTYDPATNSYLRFQAGSPQIDTETGQQLAPKNVVVVVTPPILDVGEKGRLTLDIHGHGTAYVLSNGKKIDGQWTKADTRTRMTFVDAAGQPIPLVPGLTWVEVIPNDREVLYTATE